MNSPDRRRQQVGHRKIGYCGHVPETVFFERPERVEVSIHPNRGNVEKRVPSTIRDANTRTPIEEGCVQSDVEAHNKDMDLLSRLAKPKSQERSGVTVSDGTTDSGPIAGYAGHRAGTSLRCGGRQGESKINEAVMGSTQAAAKEQSGTKFESIPRLPLVRGPQRRTPLGYDVFLTI